MCTRLFYSLYIYIGFPGGATGKEPACQGTRQKRLRFHPWVAKILWRRAWQPTPVLLPGESCGQKHLEGHSPWGHRELDTPERLSKQSICFRQTALAHLIDSTDCTAEAPFLSALGNQKVGTAHLLQHSCCDLKWSLQDLQGGTGSFMRL